jgi:hypothetical protein
MIREKYPKKFIYFCLCCRKDRWLRESVQRAKNEKREQLISKIEDIQYFMKDMKNLYIGKVFYEGHDEFMKMLFIIESMIPQIDMTIKKTTDYKIDGKIARERRFDPDHLKFVLDEMKLEVEESFDSKVSYSNSGSADKSKMKRSSSHNKSAIDKEFVPESKEELMKVFEERKGVHQINRNYLNIYNNLENNGHIMAPFRDLEEEEKIRKLETHFKNRLVKKNTEVNLLFTINAILFFI